MHRFVVNISLLLATAVGSAAFAQNTEPEQTLLTSSLGSLFVDDVDFEVKWPAADQKGLSVFWWNIARGNVTICTHGEKAVINYNLTQLIKSPRRPHILALGEYLSPGSCLEPEVVALINKHYNSHFTRYTKNQPIYLAFGIFVSKSLQLDAYQELELKWYPNDSTAESYKTTWKNKCTEAKVAGEIMYFDRTFPRLDFTVDGKQLSIIPVHMLMPWICDSESGVLGGTLAGKFITGSSTILGSGHPVYFQAKDLASKIDAALTNVAIIGDWNIPTVKAMNSATFKLFLRLGFKETTEKEWGTYSFPTSYNPEKSEHQLLLDHAFLRGKIKTTYSQILPIQGSDHYPLLTYIEME